MRYRLSTSLLFTVMLFSCLAFAQDFSNKGKDFWIGYGNHVRMFNSGNPEKMQLYITSDVSTTGQVSIASIGFNQSFSVTANQITTIDIPRTAALMDQGLYNHGIHVTAKDPVVVYSFIYVNAISGATLCLPTATLGKDYYSVNFTQRANELNCHSYFFVIAADTGTTTVEITPSADTKGGQAAGVPFTVNLTQGQVYQVLGKVSGDAGEDLTGSRIRSISTGVGGCKRIAVYSGSGKISIGCTRSGSSDNLYQQMYPTSTWGKKYITVPGLVNTTNYYRIIKSDPAATVTLNGSILSPGSFSNNFYYEFFGDTPNVIESDKPILVAQYFTTQGCAGNPGGPPNFTPGSDPEMIYLNPVEQTIDKVTLNSMQPSSGTAITAHYLNVVLKNAPAAINSFKIDGAPFNGFTPVPTDPTYAYARIPTTRGTHNVSCDTGFNIIAYGFGGAESYGYSGGTNLKDLYQFVSIHNQYGTVDFPATCKNAPFYFSMTFPYQPTQIKWQFNGLFADTTVYTPVFDSTWTVNGKQLFRYKLDKPYSLPAIGTYPVKVLAQNPMPDGCNGEQEINYDLQVYDRPLANFSFTTNGCVSDSVHFLDGSTPNGRPVAKWVWDFGDGVSGLRNPAHLFTSAATYKVKFSIITDIGCLSDTASKTIVLAQPPVAKFGITSPSCLNKGITFTDSSTSASAGIVKWYWDFGDGSPGVIATSNAVQTHIYTTTGSFNVTLKVESATGCQSTLFTKAVTVHPIPVPGFIMPDNCLTDPFSQFKDTSSIADGSSSQFTYMWNFGDNNANTANPNTSTLKDPKHKYTAVGSYNVSMTVTSGDGCAASVTQPFFINGAVPQSLFTVNGGTEQCSNTSISLTNNSKVDVGKVVRLEIQWDYVNDPANVETFLYPSSGTVFTHSYPEFFTPATKTYQVRMVVYSGDNCSNTSTQNLTLKATPQLQFDALASVCSDTLPFLITEAHLLNGLQGSGRYTGKGVSAAGMFNPRAAGPGTSTLRYTFTGTNGCSNYIEQSIQVWPAPVVSAGPDRFVLEGGTTALLGTATGNGISYQWTPALSLSNPTIAQPLTSTSIDITYTLKVRSTDGCSASDDVFVKVLKMPTIPNTFSPNGDGINDKWEIKYLESYSGSTIEVYNRYGQLVFQSTGNSKPWDGTYKGNPVPAGTYYYIINPKNGRRQMAGFVDIIR